jgi:hypothetical protein
MARRGHQPPRGPLSGMPPRSSGIISQKKGPGTYPEGVFFFFEPLLAPGGATASDASGGEALVEPKAERVAVSKLNYLRNDLKNQNNST